MYVLCVCMSVLGYLFNCLSSVCVGVCNAPVCMFVFSVVEYLFNCLSTVCVLVCMLCLYVYECVCGKGVGRGVPQ